MTQYFLGADVGATKTHVLIADEAGQAIGFGKGGPGNHEGVGYEGLGAALQAATGEALTAAGLSKAQISGLGFGVAGYDWPAEREPTLEVIRTLGFSAPVEAVNDTLLGLLAGAAEGWGIAVVSGTGCNCWGWDQTRQHMGQVTGGGTAFGEGAGASELMIRAMQALAYEWTRRGPATQLTPMLVQHAGARDLVDLLEGVMHGRYELTPAAAPLVFQAAKAGDQVALDLVRWAGSQLGELANTVIGQLGFEKLDFEIVQIGSLWDGSPMLTDVMRQTVWTVAPGARLVRLTAPPVVGAVVLGMEAAGLASSAASRAALTQSAEAARRAAPVR